MSLRHKNIAVLMTGADTDVQALVLKGIEQYGKENGCNIAVFLWFTGAFERDKHNLGEINIAYLPDLSLFDGVILFSNALHIKSNKERIEELLNQLTCPVVCIGSKIKDYYYVGADNYAAMRKLVEHYVIDHKMMKLNFVKGVSGNSDAEARYNAYVDVLSENGIPVIPGRISQGDFYVTGGELAAKEILSSKLPFPEVIICANDIMAITICDILKEKGYRVPDDVAVAGYDYSVEGQNYTPKITTVRTRFQDMGVAACKTILDVLNGENVAKEILLEDEVVLGESCNCLSKETRTIQFIERHSDVFRRKMIHQMIELEKSIMAGEDYEDWIESMKGFISQMDPTEFYCCVNENFVEDVFENGLMEQENMSTEEKLAYTSEVIPILAYQDGVFKKRDPFESRYALDDLFKDTDKGKMYIFSPLHYLERTFGYFVFVDSDFAVNNQMYIKWLLNMGDSVENIRKQNLLKNAMKRLDEMYIKDSLTGAYNRFGLERYFSEIKMKSLISKSKIQLSFVDIDGLKKINDLYGHEEGDRIINAAAEIMMHYAGKYYVIRYGGDEFIVMGTVQSEREVKKYWENVQHGIEEYNTNQKKKAMLSMSVGYDIFNVDHKTYLEDCIRITDKKMYIDKNRKKTSMNAEN